MKARVVLAVVSLVLGCTEGSPSLSLENHRRALEVLSDGIAAAGGFDPAYSLHAVTFGFVEEAVYSDFRAVGGVLVPHLTRKTVGGRLDSEVRLVETSIGSSISDSLFLRPAHATVASGQVTPPAAVGVLGTTRLADGIYLMPDVTPGYNALFVAQDDWVIVVEAIGNADLMERILTTIEATIPDKPVTYVVLTHHHYDHCGGLWGYMERGVTVITTLGVEDFVREVASGVRRGADGLIRVADPKIELVEGTRAFGSGATRMELYDVGPNPHADEILIAYFPEHRLLFLSDVYGHRNGVDDPSVLIRFAEVLEGLQLDVETVVTAEQSTRPLPSATRQRLVPGRPVGGARSDAINMPTTPPIFTLIQVNATARDAGCV